jgi:F-type H+-transporting ATPase subunit delta
MAELVSKVYAEALFDVALESAQLDLVEEQYQFVCQVFNENPEFLELYRAPNIALDERKTILDQAFSGKVIPELMNFLKLLLDKNRGFYVLQIGKEFQQMIEDHKGILKGVVSVTCALGEDQLKKLEEKLSASTGKNVMLTQKIDPEIIGGLVVQLGDKVIDNSLKKKLEDMKEDLFQLIV